MAELLSDEEIAERLPEGWSHEGDEIVRRFEYDEYLRSVNFAQMIGEIAEAQFHHPTMTIEYDGLEVRFTSHEEGGVTDQDIEMAELINTEAEASESADPL